MPSINSSLSSLHLPVDFFPILHLPAISVRCLKMHHRSSSSLHRVCSGEMHRAQVAFRHAFEDEEEGGGGDASSSFRQGHSSPSIRTPNIMKRKCIQVASMTCGHAQLNLILCMGGGAGAGTERISATFKFFNQKFTPLPQKAATDSPI